MSIFKEPPVRVSHLRRLLTRRERPPRVSREDAGENMDHSEPSTPPKPPPPRPFSPGEQSQTGDLQSSEMSKMGVNGEVLCKHWGSLWMEGNHTDQIYTGGGGWAGIWRRNTNYKKAGGPHVIMSADADTEEERWRTAGGYQQLQHRLGLHLFSFSRKVLRPSSSAAARRSMFMQCDWLIQ